MKIYDEMKDEESQITRTSSTISSVPASSTSTTASAKKEGSSGGLWGKGKYKFWVLAAILLLAFWSMFTGSLTLSLKWSSANLSLNSHTSDFPIHDDLDILELEEREKIVKHMWDVYTQSKSIRLPKFWREAFQAAYQELANESTAARNAAISEIAKMSLRSISTYESQSTSTSPSSNQQSNPRVEGKRG